MNNILRMLLESIMQQQPVQQGTMENPVQQQRPQPGAAIQQQRPQPGAAIWQQRPEQSREEVIMQLFNGFGPR